MNCRNLACLCGGAMLALAAAAAFGDVKDNPYRVIVERNVFGLRPPPPPPDPNATTNEPALPVKVYLTGISTLAGKKVLLEIVETGPGKKTERPPPLVEGERQFGVEVVSIDPDKGAVKVRIGDAESTLTFEKDGVKPAATAAAHPAGRPTPGLPAPNPSAAVNPAASNPGVVVGGGGAVVGGGVALGVPPPPGVNPAAARAAAQTAVNPNAGGAVAVGGYSSGVPTVPPRPLRVNPESTGNTMTREQAERHIEDQRRLLEEARGLNLIDRKAAPPLPPTRFSQPNPTGEGASETHAPPSVPAPPPPPSSPGYRLSRPGN